MSTPIVTQEMILKISKKWTEQELNIAEEFEKLVNVNPWLAEFIATLVLHTKYPPESLDVALAVIELLERAEKENVFANMVVREDKNGQT